MKKYIDFLIKSSADPAKTSLTVKGMLLWLVPFIMQAFDIACTAGSYCYDVTASDFEIIINAIVQFVYFSLTLLSTLMVLYGGIRKIYRTITRKNLAIND